MGTVAALVGPLDSDIPSPRGKNLSMDAWNKIGPPAFTTAPWGALADRLAHFAEGIQPFPFSSSAPSQRTHTPPPVWSSTPVLSTPPSAEPFEPGQFFEHLVRAPN